MFPNIPNKHGFINDQNIKLILKNVYKYDFASH